MVRRGKRENNNKKWQITFLQEIVNNEERTVTSRSLKWKNTVFSQLLHISNKLSSNF